MYESTKKSFRNSIDNIEKLYKKEKPSDNVYREADEIVEDIKKNHVFNKCSIDKVIDADALGVANVLEDKGFSVDVNNKKTLKIKWDGMNIRRSLINLNKSNGEIDDFLRIKRMMELSIEKFAEELKKKYSDGNYYKIYEYDDDITIVKSTILSSLIVPKIISYSTIKFICGYEVNKFSIEFIRKIIDALRDHEDYNHDIEFDEEYYPLDVINDVDSNKIKLFKPYNIKCFIKITKK